MLLCPHALFVVQGGKGHTSFAVSDCRAIAIYEYTTYRVLINAWIAGGLRAYFAVTPALVLVLLLTVVQKTAIDRVVLRKRGS